MSTDPVSNLAVLQLWQLSVTFEARLAGELAELGLSVPSFRLIGEVSRVPAGLRQGELASRLGVSAPTVSAAVTRLERDGLVERRADPDDPRARRVCLAEGANLQPGIDVLLGLEAQLLDGLSAVEEQTMRQGIAALQQRLEQVEGA